LAWAVVRLPPWGQPESSPGTADRPWLWLLTADRGFYPWQAWDTATATGAALQWRAPTQLEFARGAGTAGRHLPHRADHTHGPGATPVTALGRRPRAVILTADGAGREERGSASHAHELGGAGIVAQVRLVEINNEGGADDPGQPRSQFMPAVASATPWPVAAPRITISHRCAGRAVPRWNPGAGLYGSRVCPHLRAVPHPCHR
jgi:hypothetical protein